MILLRTASAMMAIASLLSAQKTQQELVVFRNLTRGKPLPQMSVQDLEGKEVPLEFKGDSPWILAFLRQDQEDSKLVLAMLQRLALDPKAPKSRIVIIGRKGTSTKAWTLVSKTLSHRIAIYLDENGAAKAVGAVVMPSVAILDAKGRLANSFLLYEVGLEKQIRAVLDHLWGKKTEVPGPVEAKRLLIRELDSNAAGLEATRKYAEALALRVRQAELAGDDPAILAAIGRLQFRLGKAAAAVEAYRRSLQLQDAIVVRVHLGLALLEQGSLVDARKELESALLMSTDKALVHYSLARIAKQEGNLDLALSHIKKALESVRLDSRSQPGKQPPAEADKDEENKDGE